MEWYAWASVSENTAASRMNLMLSISVITVVASHGNTHETNFLFKWTFSKDFWWPLIEQELNITPKIAECKKILEMDSVRKGIGIYSTLDFKEEVTGFEESLE